MKTTMKPKTYSNSNTNINTSRFDILQYTFVAVLLVFFLTGVSFAQGGSGPQNGTMNMGPKAGGNSMGMGALKAAFYPPKLVMRHQNDINLTEDQKETILSLINSNHSAHSRIRWDLQSKMDEMRDLVSQNDVDLQQANEKLDEILALEQQLKKMQLSALIQIKNTLTEEQEQQLDAFKAQLGQGSGNRSMKQSPKYGNQKMRGNRSGNKRNN